MPERIFTAGRLSVLYESGSIRYISRDGTEVIRQIYFALRDRDWGTIPARFLREDIARTADGWRIDLEAAHHDGNIAFRWNGTIRISPHGVSFEVSGEAESRFLKNRIGLCVLHPGQTCAGLPARVTHTDRSVTETQFPEFVSPRQPFTDVGAITHAPAPGLTATVTFEGETFETEDQRNWTDGSFKTYSTPLSLACPVEVTPGWKVHHRITVEISSADALRVTIDRNHRTSFPKPGTTVTADAPPPGLAHLRVDIHPGEEHRIAQAARFGLPLEIAIHTKNLDDLSGIVEEVQHARAEVARWITYNLPATTAKTILRGPVAAGTNANFAELNRNRHLVAGADLAIFSINPQVHGSDERTIIETLEGQHDALRSALQFAPHAAVSPVTLLPRFNAVATSGGAPPAEPPADRRQNTAFTAAWTLGSIASLATAGATSITYYEATGPRGIAGTPTAALFEAIASFAPDHVLRCGISHPLEIAALALARDAAVRLGIANLRPEPATVHVGAITVPLKAYEIQWIDL